jgi:soluble lytic murein transglycosylase
MRAGLIRRPALVLFCGLAFAQGTEDGVARLKAAMEAMDRGAAAEGYQRLRGLGSQLPQIADYVAFFTAQAQIQLKEFQGAALSVEGVLKSPVPSPLAGRAVVMGAKAQLEAGDAGAALRLLGRVPAEVQPQPDGTFVLGKAREASGDAAGAAVAYQNVYYGHPLAEEAAEAFEGMSRARSQLGARYPAPSPSALLGRAEKLMNGRQAARAKLEYQQLAGQLTGLEEERARVGVGACEFKMRRTAEALRVLNGLELSEPEAEAERLFYVASCHRRMDDNASMEEALAALSKRAPESLWRMKSLNLAISNYVLVNDGAKIAQHSKACADSFGAETDGAMCHWWTAWRAWLDRRAEAVPLMKAHLARFPESVKAGAALFYLGRASETAKDPASASRYYRELQSRYPNYYYGVLARDYLKKPEMARNGQGSEADRFLATVKFPLRETAPDFRPDPVTAKRIERARLLSRAGLDRWAEGELRYGARNGSKPWPIAMELAETASRNGEPDRAMRFIKATVPGYLFIPREAAPQRFWRLAFPFPYRKLIEENARANGLDPFVVAALIRQESEFDPKALSSAKAMGLMQIMPATGRQLSRTLKIRPYRTSSLYVPSVSVKMGTHYLGRMVEKFDGSVESALAGYNAGPTRVPKWKGWEEYREPSEFSETVPFGQTRDYIQIILRNADVYRWLYANEPVSGEEPEPTVKEEPKPAAEKKPAPAKPATAKTAKPSKKKSSAKAK